MMENSHSPLPDDLDLDLNINLTIDGIFPPLDADSAAILNPKSLSVPKSDLETGQIDLNLIEFSQFKSQLIETQVFKSSLDLDTTPEAGHSPRSHGSSGSSVLRTDVSEKGKLRRMRNRESCKLHRERKKHYYKELEDKVKILHSTIQDLNLKISHLMLENATLKSQMGSISVPSQIPPPPWMYPWMPYMMRPQVPLDPIPRLKTQPVAPPAKRSKKVDNKETEMKSKD